MLKRIAAYCGASTGNQVIYQRSTIKLGHFLAAHNFELVYGGGGVGLMGVLAQTVIGDGGVVHGIMPKELAARGASDHHLTKLTIVDNMSERKRLMMNLADGCLAIPGGPGTLEEISEAFSWARIGDNVNPCALFNVNHYFDPLATFFDQMVAQGFLTAEHRSKLLFSDNLNSIFKFMETYTAPTIRTNYEH
ncbi:TIGR00730 family Rossman fold protein [Secundilactobacillus folii]|uniref:Cytokinin riboside 5'-monophosphate phosphoribohydrolase n=1 Tax=Secundilactobacillus folii TaxID=2678357 RepID=A0A7X2XYB6_9LACO|nr:TIGR00730 family Rossman fold protein [Secundilactobacillus folii]MTV82581.1 TIGR00730 family Rossman fold protein [Secundilactobacillus folii]